MAATTRVVTFHFPDVAPQPGQAMQSDGSGGTAWGTDSDSFPPGYVDGLAITNIGTSQRRIEPGIARDNANATTIEVYAQITVDIDVSGVNGLDTGVKAIDTWYAIYVISDNGVLPVAGILSASMTGPTLPAGYDNFRLIGSARNNGSNVFYNDVMETQGPDRVVTWIEPHASLTILLGGISLLWASIDVDEYVPPTSNVIYASVVINGDAGFPAFTEFRPGGSTNGSTPMRIHAGDFSEGAIFFLSLGTTHAVEYANDDTANLLDMHAIGYIQSMAVV